MWRYREAIEIYTKGIALHPTNALFYRHRGHRYITVRELDRAVADLARAAELGCEQVARGDVPHVDEMARALEGVARLRERFGAAVVPATIACEAERTAPGRM